MLMKCAWTEESEPSVKHQVAHNAIKMASFCQICHGSHLKTNSFLKSCGALMFHVSVNSGLTWTLILELPADERGQLLFDFFSVCAF